MEAEVRPSKKQRELLSFIDGFIKGHGYGPSYREVMRALNYSSVSTVATHINNLIKKGHLRKKDNSARTLEVVSSDSVFRPKVAPVTSDEKWLIDIVHQKFDAAENATPSQKQLDNLFVLVGALYILGFKEATANLKPRLKALKQQIDGRKN
jgi:SOS-response transcriptional repressor LexA